MGEVKESIWKKMRVILINPRILFKNDKTVWKCVIGILPLIEILHMATVLRQNNIQVKVLDINAEIK